MKKTEKIKYAIVVILSFALLKLYAQDNYKPFDFENGIWICYEGLFGDEPIESKSQYFTRGDTIIYDNVYKKLIEYRIDTRAWGPGSNPLKFYGYRGAIRNLENKQVEFIEYWDTVPRIIYDFNLSERDTIKTGYGQYEPSLAVVSVDSILYCNEYHKRYNLNDLHALIEGIGSDAGLLNPYFFQFEQVSDLVCYTEKYNIDCSECDLLVSNKLTKENDQEFNLFPNPVCESLLIKFDLKESQTISIKLYNILGQLQDIIQDKVRLNTGQNSIEWERKDFIPPGIYLLVFESGGFVDSKQIILK